MFYRKIYYTLLAAILCFTLVFGSVQAEENENLTPKYQATSINRLKVRKTEAMDSRGVAGIPENTTVDILEIVGDQFKVLYRNRVGFVKARNFKDFKVNLPELNLVLPEEAFADKEPKKLISVTVNGAFDTQEEYTARYVAKNIDTAFLYADPDESAKSLITVPRYTEELTLSQIKGDWAMAQYNGVVGYIPTRLLVQYDFLDPYAERFPGIVNYKYAAVLAVDTPLYDRNNTSKVHKVIPAGAVIGVEEPDSNGFMHVAYMKRRHALIKESNAIERISVKAYDEAEKGDLISVFTSFFPVHNSNMDIIGRVYNMYHSADMLNGMIMQPGERVSMNKLIGPYKKTKGYMKAPIASKIVSTGYGGGTCQLNTTTYNSLLQVPMLVDYRRVHSKSGAVYVPIGMDAAVGNLSSVDMKFSNTLPYPIMLQYYVSENILTSLIYRAE